MKAPQVVVTGASGFVGEVVVCGNPGTAGRGQIML